MLATKAVAQPAAAAPAPVATPAVAASTFLNTIGVCTHMTQGIDGESEVATCLTYAGFRNVRDDGSPTPASIEKFTKLHADTGAMLCLLPPSASPSDWPLQYDAVAAVGGLLAIEGTNEPNNEPPTFAGEKASGSTAMPTAKFQAELYKFAKNDPHLAGIPVFASSESGGSEPDNVGLQFLTIPTPLPDGVLMPAGTGYADFANAHNYIIGNGMPGPADNLAWKAEDPTLNAQWDGLYGEYCVTWSKHYRGYPVSQLASLPRVTTETGWYTEAQPNEGRKLPVSQEQHGKILLNLYLTAVKRGWSYTFVYYLHDSAQGAFGFFDEAYKPKLAATYLHNLTTILADTGTFKPGSLAYSIAKQPETVHDLLIQKKDGTFYLAVWNDRPVGEGTDSVTVDLGGSYTVNQYDPTVGTAPTSLGKVASVPLTLTDHPVILEIR